MQECNRETDLFELLSKHTDSDTCYFFNDVQVEDGVAKSRVEEKDQIYMLSDVTVGKNGSYTQIRFQRVIE